MQLNLNGLEELLTSPVESQGCDLWGIEQSSQGNRSILRIFIDSEDGITVKDCERVSRQISSVLDVEEPIKSEYVLEVSSPGMDRPLFKLEHYQKYIGNVVSVKLRSAFEGRRNFKGLLSAIEDDELVIQVDKEEYLIPVESIEKGKLEPAFDK